MQEVKWDHGNKTMDIHVMQTIEALNATIREVRTIKDDMVQLHSIVKRAAENGRKKSTTNEGNRQGEPSPVKSKASL